MHNIPNDIINAAGRLIVYHIILWMMYIQRGIMLKTSNMCLGCTHIVGPWPFRLVYIYGL